jgi:hypothetical protein
MFLTILLVEFPTPCQTLWQWKKIRTLLACDLVTILLIAPITVRLLKSTNECSASSSSYSIAISACGLGGIGKAGIGSVTGDLKVA